MAVGVLVVNDRYLKSRWPGVVTGKASDFAGLLFFPLLLASIYEVTRWATGSRDWHATPKVVVFSMVVTALGFASLKLSPSAASLYVSLVQKVTGRGHKVIVDHSDLIALPAVLATWPIYMRQRRDRSHRSVID